MSGSLVPGPLSCHCSLGALWRDAQIRKLPALVGEDGLEVGQHHTDKRFCRALLSLLRSLCGARRPIWPLSDLLASDAPFQWGQAPCLGWSTSDAHISQHLGKARPSHPSPQTPVMPSPIPFYCLQRDKWLPTSTPKCTSLFLRLLFLRALRAEARESVGLKGEGRGRPGDNPQELSIADPPCPPRKDAGDL